MRIINDCALHVVNFIVISLDFWCSFVVCQSWRAHVCHLECLSHPLCITFRSAFRLYLSASQFDVRHDYRVKFSVKLFICIVAARLWVIASHDLVAAWVRVAAASTPATECITRPIIQSVCIRHACAETPVVNKNQKMKIAHSPILCICGGHMCVSARG